MDYTAGIVSILDALGNIVGTGFIVSKKDRLIVTCAHVVRAAQSGSTVVIRFRGSDPSAVRERSTVVVPQFWRDVKAGNIAFLRCDGELPASTVELPLGSSEGTSGHEVHIFGYPASDALEGLPDILTVIGPASTTGEQPGKSGIVGLSAVTGIRLLALKSSVIQPGFGGAPAWDPLRQRVIGMVVTFAKPDRLGNPAFAGFVLPSEALREVCHVLSLSDICPYRGLEPFTREEADFFCGRGEVVEALLQSLRQEPRFLAVLGPPGSGKSSLVQAGLLPQLERGAVPGSERWAIFFARPADRPREQLEESGLMGASEGLVEAARSWLAAHSDHTRLVIAIDPFEELFVACPESLRTLLIAMLANLLSSDLPISVILCLRDDFYPCFLTQAAALVPWLERGTVQIPPTLRESDLREIITQPARAAGLALEAGLAETLIADSQGAGRSARSTLLPLLQFALTELYARRHDGTLTHAAYRAIGGVADALNQWADRAFYSLDAPLQPVARRILTDLVEPANEHQALPDSRRKRPITELYGEEGAQDAVHQVIAHLKASETRLLVSAGDEVELIHDALLQEWVLLRQWLQEDRPFQLWRQELEANVQRWVESSPDTPTTRDDNILLRESALEEALTWLQTRRLQLTPSERDYIQASVALREREQAVRRRGRFGILVRAVAASAIFLVLGALAGLQWRRMEEQHQKDLERSQHIERAAQGDQGKQAVLLSQQSGKEVEALLLAIQAVGPSLLQKRNPPPEAFEGLVMATDGLRELAVLQGHTKPVLTAAFSLDGTRLITAGLDNTARLWDGQTGKFLAELKGHAAAIDAVAFSPDGARVVTASADHTARLWDAQTGKLLTPLLGHLDVVRSVAFSPNGARIVTASWDKTARLWDAQTGKPMGILKGHTGEVVFAAFSPDGGRIVTTSNDHTARLWDAQTGQPLVALTGHLDVVSSAAFSPDGMRIVTASWDKTARLWDALTGRQVGVLQGHSGPILSISFAQSGTRIVTSSADHTARLWDGATGKPLAALRGHSGLVSSAAFSPNEMLIVTASEDHTARLWDLHTGQSLAQLKGHSDEVSSAAFSPDGARIVTTSSDSTARLWDGRNGKSLAVAKEPVDLVYSAAFSPDGARIVTASSDRTAHLWDGSTLKPIGELKGHMHPVLAVSFSPDGARIVTASSDRTARLWEGQTGKPLAELKGHTGGVVSVAFSPDGARIVTASEDHTARLWEGHTGRPLATLAGHADVVNAVAFSPDGARIVTGSLDHTARLWDGQTGKPLAQLRGHTDVINAAAFSPDGARIVTASNDHTARLWDAQTGKPLVELKGHTQPVLTVAFSPDGARIVTAGSDRTARLWDGLTGKPLTELKGHTGPVRSALFSADGTRIVTASFDHTARLWEGQTGKPLGALQGHRAGLNSAAFSPDGTRVVTAGEDGTVRIYPATAEGFLRMAANLFRYHPEFEKVRSYCEPYLDSGNTHR